MKIILDLPDNIRYTEEEVKEKLAKFLFKSRIMLKRDLAEMLGIDIHKIGKLNYRSLNKIAETGDESRAVLLCNQLRNRSVLFKTLEKECNFDLAKKRYFAYIIREKIKPSFMIIFNTRNFINPLYWYYSADEKLPEETRFTVKRGGFDEDTRNYFRAHQTVGLLMLEHIKKRRLMARLCKQYTIKYNQTMDCLFQTTHQNGVIGYKRLPGFDMIMRLRDIIAPDLWYIFPDELDKTIDIEATLKAKGLPL